MGEPSQRSPEQCELGDFLQGWNQKRILRDKDEEKKKKAAEEKKKKVCTSVYQGEK